MTRTGYPSDVSDDEWMFVAPYLTLMTEDTRQREHSLREFYNGLRYIVRTGMQWRFMPNDLPPWHTVYQQAQGWVRAGVFEDMVHDVTITYHRKANVVETGFFEQSETSLDRHPYSTGSTAICIFTSGRWQCILEPVMNFVT